MNVVVTGASKGIGYAIAETLLREYEARGEQINLAICARNTNELEHAVVQLTGINPSATILTERCDVSNEKDVRSFAESVNSKFGSVDVLINNAGFGTFKAVTDISLAEFNDVIDANLRGVFLTTKAFLDGMLKKNSGTIVTISSLAGKNGFKGGSAYCASKFGVRGLMQSLFLEVRDRNIRVVTICPGSVDTAFFSGDA